ncbi:MAG: dynamin family protein, partial [Paracoccaceae bacterium]|nr:dynamin family protein [Paracoccaceae bacterium]
MAYDRTIPGAVSPERAERLSAWAQRKPRVALMGEFSAGKSTLLNFLIEENVIPTRATATEVPPVWFSHGDGDTFWVDAEGDSHPIRNDQIGEVPMSARYVRVFSKAEILEHCDIVDTPGISDPNLAVESWRFAAGVANMVLWCSSATQAW